ncbi:hypothetical protein OIV83_001177 [Microbotryomycetes sp. JL201]|nr:hypothetical protein OIV83_001177 [Microbotryomycetes sp. JL201]
MVLMKSAFFAVLAASTVLAGPTSDKDLRKAEQRCSQLAKLATAKFKDVTVLMTKVYPDNSTIDEPTAIAQYGAPVVELPAMCRFAANITTSPNSKVKFELWMPLKWTGRLTLVGNGGMAGGVNYPDMWGPIARYGMAVASTDTGHTGDSGDGTFLIKGPATQIDFGWRAVHLTATYSKQIVKDFYKSAAHHSYWVGCSSGGKQGLRELQQFPDTFDGVIAGASAQWWTHLNAQTYRINALVNTLNSTGFLAPKDYAVIGAAVMEQCDELDGLKDRIITDPSKCKPDLTSVTCTTPGANQSACITPAQASTMKKIWSEWRSQDGSEFLFFGFNPGSEGAPNFSVNGVPYGEYSDECRCPGPDFFNYQVLNNTKVGPFYANETEIERLLKIADATDPGQTNAIKADISPFLRRGKLITYVGLADTLIPSGMTPWYHEQVSKAVPRQLVDNSFQMYLIPQLGHCRGGNAAGAIGQGGQRPLSQNGTFLPAVSNDAKYDMIQSLIDWTERGKKPIEFIGTKYVNDNKNHGVQFQRPVCPYPKQPKYLGGDPNKASSFKCA